MKLSEYIQKTANNASQLQESQDSLQILTGGNDITKNRANELRTVIETVVETLDEDTIVDYPELVKQWEPNVELTAGEHRVKDGVVYTVLQDHTSSSAWQPEDTPSLYSKLLTSLDGTILEWEQPDSTNAYMQGDKVTHNGKTWISTIDYNVWEPGVYGWEKVEE